MTSRWSTEQTVTREAYFRARGAEPSTVPTLTTVERQILFRLRALNEAGEQPNSSTLAVESVTKGRADIRSMIVRGWIEERRTDRSRHLTITDAGRARLALP